MGYFCRYVQVVGLHDDTMILTHRPPPSDIAYLPPAPVPVYKRITKRLYSTNRAMNDGYSAPESGRFQRGSSLRRPRLHGRLPLHHGIVDAVHHRSCFPPGRPSNSTIAAFAAAAFAAAAFAAAAAATAAAAAAGKLDGGGGLQLEGPDEAALVHRRRQHRRR